MIQFFTLDDINELVLKGHSYISKIGIKIINDKVCTGSSILEGHFYRFLNLLDVVESRKDFDTTDDKFQQLIYRLYGYVSNECVYYNSLYLELGESSNYVPITISTTFLALLDTPDSYLGQSGKVVTVNQVENGLEFIELSIITADNGLTKTDNNIQLGGNLIQNTLINSDSFNFNITSQAGGNTAFLELFNQDFNRTRIGFSDNGNSPIYTSQQFFFKDRIDIQTGTDEASLIRLLFNNGQTGDDTYSLKVFDGTLNKGMQYALDYSTLGKLDDRWIPDWGTVKSVIPVVTGFVPYTGANNNVNLGANNITAANATAQNITATSDVITPELLVIASGKPGFSISANTTYTALRAYDAVSSVNGYQLRMNTDGQLIYENQLSPSGSISFTVNGKMTATGTPVNPNDVVRLTDLSSGSLAPFMHLTGNINETANGIKTFAPTLTFTANNQTKTAMIISPAIDNTGGFLNPNINAINASGNILAQSFRGTDTTIIGTGASGLTTIGPALRVRLQTQGFGSQTIFDGGQLVGNTIIRPYHSEFSLNLATDGGQVVIGSQSLGSAIGASGDTISTGLNLNQVLQPQSNNNTLVALDINTTFGTGNTILTYDTLVGGTGYTNGSYTNVPIINGSGSYAKANIVVSGGTITTVTITNGGVGYVVGDIINFTNSLIGIGGGLSASMRVATLGQYTGSNNIAIRSSNNQSSFIRGLTSFGDTTTGQRDLVVIGTSIAVAKGFGSLLDTDSYAFKSAQQLGFNLINLGLSGRQGQSVVLAANIPTYRIGSILVFETVVNDAIKDVSLYTPALFTTSMNTSIANAISKGWPTNRIIIFIASSWTTTVFPNHGDIPTRYADYAAACVSLASSNGCLYYSNYSGFEAANTAAGGTLLYSDNLHPTPLGQDNIATSFITFASSSITASSLIDNKINDYGSGSVTGNFNVLGQTNLFNTNISSDLTLTSFTSQVKLPSGKANNIVVGGNFNDIGYSFNTRKVGGIVSNAYFDNGFANTAMILSDNASSTSSLLQIGGSTGFGLYPVSDILLYTSTTPSTVVSGIQRQRIFPSGNVLFGIGTSDPNFAFSLTTTSTRGFNGFNSALNISPIANNANLQVHNFDGIAATGTGWLTATITTNTTSAADGTYTAQAIVATSGIGTGGAGTFTVVGGVVTVVTQTTGGVDFAIGNTFTSAVVPGAIFTISTLGYTGNTISQAVFTRYPIRLSSISVLPTNGVSGQVMNKSTVPYFYDTAWERIVLQTDVLGTSTQIPIYNAAGLLVPTTVTGTGAPVKATSPTLVTPILGTPTSVTLTNATGLPTAGLVNNSVTYAKMQAMTTNRLLGSGASGTAVAEITLGTGLSFTGTTLNAATGLTNPMTTLGDVIYGGASGTPTRLAGNTTTAKQFLTSTGSVGLATAPTFFDLFGSSNLWTGVNKFTFGVGISSTSPITFYGSNNINAVNLIADDSGATNYNISLPAMTAQASVAVSNSTTVVLSLATLNSTYPNAKVGTNIVCDAIIAGAIIYIKASGSNWLSVASTLVV